MLNTSALSHQAVLETKRLRLVQLGSGFFGNMWTYLQDGEGRRLTGTHQEFTQDVVRHFLEGLPRRDDRADWAMIRADDGRFVGEAVLNDLDTDSLSMNFRIGLAPESRGEGLGTEATSAVIDYAFEQVGLHRVSLGVFEFNPAAQRVYEKAGFVREGVARDALLWDGQWHHEVLMGILSTDPRTQP